MKGDLTPGERVDQYAEQLSGKKPRDSWAASDVILDALAEYVLPPLLEVSRCETLRRELTRTLPSKCASLPPHIFPIVETRLRLLIAQVEERLDIPVPRSRSLPPSFSAASATFLPNCLGGSKPISFLAHFPTAARRARARTGAPGVSALRAVRRGGLCRGPDDHRLPVRHIPAAYPLMYRRDEIGGPDDVIEMGWPGMPRRIHGRGLGASW